MNDQLRAQAFNSRLARQAMIASDVIQAVFDHVGECWDALSMEEIFCAQEIILTGCGDSYCAAVATQPLFEKMTFFIFDDFTIFSASTALGAE